MKTMTIFYDGDCTVILEQRANRTFRVTYGLQVKDGLTYADACMEYGACVFHSLACAGILDNSEGPYDA